MDVMILMLSCYLTLSTAPYIYCVTTVLKNTDDHQLQDVVLRLIPMAMDTLTKDCGSILRTITVISLETFIEAAAYQ